MSNRADHIEAVAHEVGSKAASLKGAAALLRKATPAERDELLSLMAEHARSLARFLARFRKAGRQP